MQNHKKMPTTHGSIKKKTAEGNERHWSNISQQGVLMLNSWKCSVVGMSCRKEETEEDLFQSEAKLLQEFSPIFVFPLHTIYASHILLNLLQWDSLVQLFLMCCCPTHHVDHVMGSGGRERKLDTHPPSGPGQRQSSVGHPAPGSSLKYEECWWLLCINSTNIAEWLYVNLEYLCCTCDDFKKVTHNCLTHLVGLMNKKGLDNVLCASNTQHNGIISRKTRSFMSCKTG